MALYLQENARAPEPVRDDPRVSAIQPAVRIQVEIR
jgi:hypothetical protein